MKTQAAPSDLGERLDLLEWTGLEQSLWERGHVQTAPLLSRSECAELMALYRDDARFRSWIEMARYRFGEGDYKYFAAPLPPIVQQLREALYEPLARVANGWMEALGDPTRYPNSLRDFHAVCAKQGQTKPTPLILHYEAGGYNCLHQDIYGDVAFPLQVVVGLSEPDVEYTGGEFLMVEQRPRAQSVGEALRLEQGALTVFTTRTRPIRGSRGYYRGQLKHGVSRVRTGARYTLGIIFHDAK
jgi:uncharacterized protein